MGCWRSLVLLILGLNWGADVLLAQEPRRSATRPSRNDRETVPAGRPARNATETVKETTTTKTPPKEPERVSTKVLWFGLNGGPLISDSTNEKDELSKTGYSLGLRGSFSYLTEAINLELSAEWLNTVLSATAEDKILTAAGTTTIPEGLRTTEIRTRLGVGSLSLRFRLFDNRMEIGPTASMFFGTDTSFSPHESEVSRNPNVMMGANLVFNLKLPTDRSLSGFRMFAQYLHDVTIESRQVQLVNVGLDFGVSFASEKPTVIVKEKVRTRVEYRTKTVRDTTVVSTESYLIDAGVVNFQTAKHDIDGNVQAYLRDLATYLHSREADWTDVRLVAHTDARGSRAYNEGLSRRRADAVLGFFVRAGIAAGRLRVESHAFDQPVDRNSDSVALAKNRRVEILVRGGPNTPILKQEVLRLQQLHRIPATCQGVGCQ